MSDSDQGAGGLETRGEVLFFSRRQEGTARAARGVLLKMVGLLGCCLLAYAVSGDLRSSGLCSASLLVSVIVLIKSPNTAPSSIRRARMVDR